MRSCLGHRDRARRVQLTIAIRRWLRCGGTSGMRRTWVAMALAFGLAVVPAGCSKDGCDGADAPSASAVAKSFISAVANSENTCGFTGVGTEFSGRRLDQIREAVAKASGSESLTYNETSDFANTALVHVLNADLDEVVTLYATASDGGVFKGERWTLVGDRTKDKSPEPTSDPGPVAGR